MYRFSYLFLIVFLMVFVEKVKVMNNEKIFFVDLEINEKRRMCYYFNVIFKLFRK